MLPGQAGFLQEQEGGLGELHRLPAPLVGEPVHEVLGQDRDVLGPVGQGRHHHPDGAHPVEQVGPEQPLPHQGLQVLVGGGQEAEVHLPVVHLPQAAEALLLQGLEQLGLDLQVHVAQFVQEHGAPVGGLQQADLGVHGAGEGALLVAEQLGLQELAGEAAAVQFQQGLGGPGAVPVHPAGQFALAGAGLALDQDRALGAGGPPGLLLQAADGRAEAQEQLQGTARLVPGGVGQLPAPVCAGSPRSGPGPPAGPGGPGA